MIKFKAQGESRNRIAQVQIDSGLEIFQQLIAGVRDAKCYSALQLLFNIYLKSTC